MADNREQKMRSAQGILAYTLIPAILGVAAGMWLNFPPTLTVGAFLLVSFSIAVIRRVSKQETALWAIPFWLCQLAFAVAMGFSLAPEDSASWMGYAIGGGIWLLVTGAMFGILRFYTQIREAQEAKKAVSPNQTFTPTGAPANAATAAMRSPQGVEYIERVAALMGLSSKDGKMAAIPVDQILSQMGLREETDHLNAEANMQRSKVEMARGIMEMIKGNLLPEEYLPAAKVAVATLLGIELPQVETTKKVFTREKTWTSIEDVTFEAALEGGKKNPILGFMRGGRK